MKRFSMLLLVISILFISCNKEVNKNNETENKSEYTIKDIQRQLEDADNDSVMIVAHRGDWRNAPENSLRAIENCIDMNLDMVEIDIRMTKDSQLVLMHDKTLDRTTTATGKVSDYNLDELTDVRLTTCQGLPTRHHIPTLEEAMELAKGKIMLNVDKAFDYFDKVYELSKKTGTVDHILYKTPFYGEWIDYEKLTAKYGEWIDSVYFMPVIYLDFDNAQQIINSFMESKKKPVAIEFVFSNTKEELNLHIPDTAKALEWIQFADSLSPVVHKFQDFRDKGVKVWVNSLWPFVSGGYDDERAVEDPDGAWGWLIDKNVNMIQTDRPEMLLEYLRSKNLHY